MRLSKKLLREAKNGMSRRTKELLSMDDTTLTKEFIRCFPNVERIRADEIRNYMIQDLIELTFPEHWFV